MDQAELREGKERVDGMLIQHLEARGMDKPVNMKADRLEAMFDRLRAVLAHMPADKLAALAEICIRAAGGKARDRWPAEVSILNWARAMCPPPRSDSRLVISYMASAVGRRALRGGWHGELLRFLKRAGMAPGPSMLDRIETEGRARAAQAEDIRRQVAMGRASLSERRLLDDFDALERRAAALVERQAAVEAATDRDVGRDAHPPRNWT